MKGLTPRLLRIVTAYGVNQVGTWFGYVALSVAVYDETHSALAVAALLAAAEALPGILVPVLVARVETSSRRHALSALYFFEAVIAAALAVCVGSHFALPIILVLAALDGLAAIAARALIRAEASRTGSAAYAQLGDPADGDADGAMERVSRTPRSTSHLPCQSSPDPFSPASLSPSWAVPPRC